MNRPWRYIDFIRVALGNRDGFGGERPNNSDLVFCREHRPGESRLPSSPKQPPLRTWAGWASGIRAAWEGSTGGKISSFEFVKSSTVPSHVLGTFSGRIPLPESAIESPSNSGLIQVYSGLFIIRLELAVTGLERIDNDYSRNEDNKDNWIKIIDLRMDPWERAQFCKITTSFNESF